jgi:hypothetical protein
MVTAFSALPVKCYRAQHWNVSARVTCCPWATVASTCSAAYGFHHACVAETIFMGLLYFVNKKFLSDHDAVCSWTPIQLLRSTDRLPQYLKQTLCYWKWHRPPNMRFKFSTTSSNNMEGARTSEVVETHPLLKVESRLNATSLRKYTQLLFRLSLFNVTGLHQHSGCTKFSAVSYFTARAKLPREFVC